VGDIEPFYCETVDYIRHLQESGVEAELDVYPGWFHAYDLFFPAKKVVREAISRFEEHFAYAQAHYFAPQDPSGDSRPLDL
jgi:acetyl esterase/lipase